MNNERLSNYERLLKLQVKQLDDLRDALRQPKQQQRAEEKGYSGMIQAAGYKLYKSTVAFKYYEIESWGVDKDEAMENAEERVRARFPKAYKDADDVDITDTTTIDNQNERGQAW